jgi:hypothetical protein
MKHVIVLLVVAALLISVAGCAAPIRAMGNQRPAPEILRGPYEAPLELMPVQEPQLSARLEGFLRPYEAPQLIQQPRPQILLDPYE